MQVKQEIKGSQSQLSCFDRISSINQIFYVEKLLNLVTNFKRNLLLGQGMVIIKYLELIFLSNNQYIIQQLQVSEPYLVEISDNDLGTFLKSNESFALTLSIAGLFINVTLIIYILTEYIVFAFHSFKGKSLELQEITGISSSFSNERCQDTMVMQRKQHKKIVKLIRSILSFVFQMYSEILIIPFIFISSVNIDSGISYSLLVSTYIIGKLIHHSFFFLTFFSPQKSKKVNTPKPIM